MKDPFGETSLGIALGIAAIILAIGMPLIVFIICIN